MSMFSALGFSGFDPWGSYLESQFNAHAARASAKLQYKYAEKYAKNMPTWNRAGLEAAGYNPILAVNSGTPSPTLTNADVNPVTVGDAGYDQSDTPKRRNIALQHEVLKAELEQKNSASAVNRAQEAFIKAQTKRAGYIPITEQDNGGVTILGSGFNTGGSDTLLYDIETGTLIRPKDTSPHSSKSQQDVKPPVRSDDVKKSPFNFTPVRIY